MLPRAWKTSSVVSIAKTDSKSQARRLEPPFWPPKDFIYTALTVHFKWPTVGKWSTTGTSSLAAVENHRCPSKSGCSNVGLFLEDQRLTRAHKPLYGAAIKLRPRVSRYVSK